LLKAFDPQVPAPAAARPFLPFAEPYLTGPVPANFKTQTARRLAAVLTRLPDDEAAALVEFGSFWLDDRPCLDPGRPLAAHQSFRLNPPAYGPIRFYEADPARIVYEDEDLLIYNKESGRPSQAVPHDAHNNILAALGRLLTARDRRADLWLSHRLDADTSGLLLMAKNKEAAGRLGRAFQEGRVAKEYLCLGLGQEPEKSAFEIDAPIAKDGRRYVVRPGGPGLASRTGFKVLGRTAHPYSEPGRVLDRVLFLAAPLTGRTHQVRLHLAFAGWPIEGDRFYGRPEAERAHPAPRLMLVSASLAFRHPGNGREMRITHPALSDF
jgi:Pseudouridylate synthases, 23S RNA-specific